MVDLVKEHCAHSSWTHARSARFRSDSDAWPLSCISERPSREFRLSPSCRRTGTFLKTSTSLNSRVLWFVPDGILFCAFRLRRLTSELHQWEASRLEPMLADGRSSEGTLSQPVSTWSHARSGSDRTPTLDPWAASVRGPVVSSGCRPRVWS